MKGREILTLSADISRLRFSVFILLQCLLVVPLRAFTKLANSISTGMRLAHLKVESLNVEDPFIGVLLIGQTSSVVMKFPNSQVPSVFQLCWSDFVLVADMGPVFLKEYLRELFRDLNFISELLHVMMSMGDTWALQSQLGSAWNEGVFGGGRRSWNDTHLGGG